MLRKFECSTCNKTDQRRRKSVTYIRKDICQDCLGSKSHFVSIVDPVTGRQGFHSCQNCGGTGVAPLSQREMKI